MHDDDAASDRKKFPKADFPPRVAEYVAAMADLETIIGSVRVASAPIAADTRRGSATFHATFAFCDGTTVRYWATSDEHLLPAQHNEACDWVRAQIGIQPRSSQPYVGSPRLHAAIVKALIRNFIEHEGTDLLGPDQFPASLEGLTEAENAELARLRFDALSELSLGELRRLKSPA